MTERVDPATLRDLLLWDDAIAALVWRERPASLFSENGNGAQRNSEWWNRRFAGKPAFTDNGKGYLSGRIFGQICKGHHVAFAYFNGRWPEGQIDHINGDRSDNSRDNLREASNRENSRNRAISSRNTSGVVGVSWSKQRGKWYSYIRADGHLHSLGFYENKNEAVAARKQAEREHGFHENHGRVA